ncbi:MAG: hypothetical protein RLZZ09_578 [Pseudomonadota bacterium]|jgi:hypothetical protein
MTHTQVLLVSHQAAPNLLAALDPGLKPAEAVLVVSDKMRERADALERVLREAGVRTHRQQLPNEHDYPALEAALMDLAAERDGEAIALNVTGGTKLMALAAQSIALAAGWKVFYVDADTDEVIWLGRQAGQRQRLTEQLRLRHYLMGYGFTLGASSPRPLPDAGQEDLIHTLLLQIGSLEKPLGQLNWLAQRAEDRRSLSITLDAEKLQPDPNLEALLRQFQAAGVLTVTGAAITFPDEARRGFAKGGWLEQHLHRVVSGLGGTLGLRDLAANLEVTDAGGVTNELDLAFLARNRLFIVECKTARMDKPNAPKANDTLFKLAEIVRRVGGLGARGLLASYRPLRDSEQRLARALGIELVCGPELARLPSRLKCWVEGGRG